MKRFFLCIAIVIALLTLALVLHAAQSLSAALQVGSVFPAFSGRTITGSPLTLPGSPLKKHMVLVFSFSRMAGKDARWWNEHRARDFPDNVSAFGSENLSAFSGLWNQRSHALVRPNRTIVLYRDEQLWKQRLAVKDESRAYVVLLDRSGIICWMNSGAFSDGTYGMLKAKLAALPPWHR